MSDSLDITVIAATGTAVGSILTIVFGFLLKWRSGEKKPQSDDKKPKVDPLVAVESAKPSPRIAVSSNPGLPMDTGRFQALVDMSTVDWETFQKHVEQIAAQQPVTNAKFDEAVTGVRESVRDVRTDVSEVKADVARVEKKLDEHIAENGGGTRGKCRPSVVAG